MDFEEAIMEFKYLFGEVSEEDIEALEMIFNDCMGDDVKWLY